MRRATCYITSDGESHRDLPAAKKHAEKRYGDLLLTLSRALVPLNYTATSEFIDANLEQFAQLQALKEDCQVDAEEESD